MEKKDPSIRRNLGNATLYLDGLEEIVRLLQQEGFRVKVTIENRNNCYEFDGAPTADEIKLMDSPVYHSLYITAEGDIALSIHLNQGSASLSLSGSTTKDRGVYEKVLSILNPNPIVLIPTLYLVSLITLPLLLSAGTAVLGSFLWVLLIGNVLLILLGINKIFFRYSTIYLKRKKEMPSFWQRKKDDIIHNVISAVIGAALTLGITQLVQNKIHTESPAQTNEIATQTLSVSNHADTVQGSAP
ncbi:MAG: hypothetical protein PHP93_02340 [Kiritimatiellales bacterium]|nr:hypothetical protein [Kiritimatiellales bacterium]